MGYFKDEHWIIEANEEILKKFRNEIIDEIGKAFKDEEVVDYTNYVSPVLTGLANMYACLFLPADGSKEGWTTSNCMDDARENIMKKIILNNAKNDFMSKINVLKVVVDEYEDKPSVSWLTRND
jgi:hypothetical protein